MAGFGGWVDKRIQGALDYAVGQLGDPDSKYSKALEGVTERLADKVGDRVDQTVDRVQAVLQGVPEMVDRAGDKVRDDVRQTILNLAADGPAIARHVVDAMRELLPGDLFGQLGGLLGGNRRMGFAAVPPPTTEREPEDKGH